MTCLDKLKLDHPKMTDSAISAMIDNSCPWHYGYMAPPENCQNSMAYPCILCWNREIPNDKEPTNMEETMTETNSPVIKDSGDRTKFDTGAVRDMRTGKGRCDLMPLEVAADYLTRDGKPDRILLRIRQFQKSNDTKYLQIALDNFNEIHWMNNKTMLLEVAKHFEEGALKYGENNWQKGIPTYCYIDSAVRHYLKWLRGDKDEPHDRAFVWNLMCCIWEVDYHKEVK